MCKVKAIASSVERLLRYANYSRFSEASCTEQMSPPKYMVVTPMDIDIRPLPGSFVTFM